MGAGRKRGSCPVLAPGGGRDPERPVIRRALVSQVPRAGLATGRIFGLYWRHHGELAFRVHLKKIDGSCIFQISLSY